MNSSLKAAVKKFGTPLYVYDQALIEKRCRELKRNFPGFHIHYAIKANSNPSILKIIHRQGISVETVSPGELRLAKATSFTRDQISFTCSSIGREDLSFASSRAHRVCLDSLTQLEEWGRLKLGPEVSLRLNQGIGAGHHRHVITGGPDSKFGITLADLPKAKALAKRYRLSITGLQQHIGSNVLDENTFLKSVQVLLATAEALPDVSYIDFGGGLGVPYKPRERALGLKRLGKEMLKLTSAFERKVGKKIIFALEPGRFIVAEAGLLLVTVMDHKKTEKHTFVGVNSGLGHLIRPAMYGSYHHITNVSRTAGPKKSVTVVGNICESGDIFAVDRLVVLPRIGDVLAIHNAGAYGMSMASDYNLRPRPREVLIHKGHVEDVSFEPRRFTRPAGT